MSRNEGERPAESTEEDDDEEDWEISVGTVKIKLSEPLQQEKEKVSVMPRKIVAMPPPADSHNVIPPDGGAFNSYPGQSMSLQKPIVVPIVDNGEEIEGILSDALGNPRERLNCLQIEDQMLRFCQSPALTLEIPPQKNSFQRRVVFMLAARFRLQHAGYSKAEGENSACFKKTEQTIIPARLLISGDDSATDRVTFSGGNAMYDGGAPPAVPAPKVMQRKPSHENLNKQNNKKKVALSEEEQERQYEEARARIFAATEGDKSSSGADAINEGSGDGSTPTPPPIEDQMQKLDMNSNGASTNSGGNNNKVAGKGGGGKGKGNRDGGKAIMKNMQDRGDPDFTRRGRGMPPPPTQQPQQMNPQGPPGMYGMPYPGPYGYPQYAMPPNYYAPPPPQYYIDPNAAGYPNAVPIQYAGYQQPPYPPHNMGDFMQPGMHPANNLSPKNGNGNGAQGFVNVNGGGNNSGQGQGKKKKNNNRSGNNNGSNSNSGGAPSVS